MKVSFINNHFEVEDKTISIFVEGKLKYILETSSEDTMDIALTILDKGEEAVILLKNFPEFITISWAQIASQLKAAGMVVKEKFSGFKANVLVPLKNHGMLEVDRTNNWVRTRTASGAIYYPEKQPDKDFINRVIELAKRSEGNMYATSLIKSIDACMMGA